MLLTEKYDKILYERLKIYLWFWDHVIKITVVQVRGRHLVVSFLYTIYYPIHQFYYKHILLLHKDHKYHLYYTQALLKEGVSLARMINSPVLPRMLCFLFFAFFFILFSSWTTYKSTFHCLNKPFLRHIKFLSPSDWNTNI